MTDLTLEVAQRILAAALGAVACLLAREWLDLRGVAPGEALWLRWLVVASAHPLRMGLAGNHRRSWGGRLLLRAPQHRVCGRGRRIQTSRQPAGRASRMSVVDSWLHLDSDGAIAFDLGALGFVPDGKRRQFHRQRRTMGVQQLENPALTLVVGAQ